MVSKSEAITRHARYYVNILNNIDNSSMSNQHEQAALTLSDEWAQISTSFNKLKRLIDYPFANQLLTEFTTPIVRNKLSFSQQIEWIQTVMDASRNCDDNLILVYCLNWLAHVYHVHDNPDQSLFYLLEAVDKAKESRDTVALLDLFNRIGGIYSETHKTSEAIPYFRAVIYGSRKISEPEQEINAMHSLVMFHLAHHNHKKAQYCIKRIFDLARKYERQEWRAKGHDLLGTIQRSLNNLDEALKHYQFSLEICEQDNNLFQIASILSSIGGILELQKNFQSAMDHYQKSLTLYTQIGHQRECAQQLKDIGDIHTELGSIHEAIAFYSRALSIYKEYEINSGIFDCYEKIGIMQQKSEEYQLAIESYNAALAYTTQAKDRYWANYRLGKCHEMLEHYSVSIPFYQSAITCAEESEYYQGKVNCLQHMADCAEAVKQYPQAISYWQKSIELAQKHNFISDTKYGLWKQADIYSEIQEFESAIANYCQCLKIAVDTQDISIQTMSLKELAGLFYEVDRFTEAVDYLNNLLQLPIDENEKGIAYNLLGHNYFALGNVENATRYYVQAKRMFESLGQTDYVDIINNNLQMINGINDAE